MISTGLTIWLLLLGPVLASFVTALAGRICADEPLWSARSRCTGCGRVLRVRDLVPILSWPILGGRCRDCGAPIPQRIWLAEIAGLGLVVVAIWRADSAAEAIAASAFLVLLLGLFQTDHLCMRLPDIFTAPLLVAGLWLGVAERGTLETVSAALFGPAVLWAIAEAYRRSRGRQGMGLGDIKMMAGLSAACGLLALPWITLLAASTALALAAVRQVRGGGVAGTDRIAFGCHLAVAGGVVWMFAS